MGNSSYDKTNISNKNRINYEISLAYVDTISSKCEHTNFGSILAIAPIHANIGAIFQGNIGEDKTNTNNIGPIIFFWY